MKQKHLNKLRGIIVALSLLMTVGASAQTTLASWTFETGYNVSELTYTPNTDASSNVTEWFNAGQPIILPNTYVGTQGDYQITGKSARYWQFCDGYNNRVLRIENTTEANAITDFTDASQHLNYYEVSFPATGYKDINVTWAIAYGGNAEADINAVVSTDGGTTWAYAGTGKTAGGWWTYTERSVPLAVANQASVKVRLLFGNEFKSNWNMDYLNITGTAITSETFYTVSAAPDNNSHGVVTMLPAGGTYESGTSVTVTATKATGYKFKEWQVGGSAVSSDNPYVFTVNANTTLTAVFTSNTTYTLATSYSPAYVGQVTRSLVQNEYDANASITLTATPNTGYAFVEWQDGSGNQLSTENPYTFNINANTTAVAIFKKSPVAADTEITVAGWTFNTGYDIDGLVYTPNTNAFAEVAQTQAKNNQVKQFNANTAYKALTDYVATVSNDNTGKTYYSIKGNNTDQVFSLYPSGISNDISDYTDAQQHTVYYQFSFPTIGLKDISVSVAFTYGSNAVRNLELVYSTDGGTTWADGGACAGGANWYTYTTTNKSLSADNKNEVIVRLLPANGEDGDYRMNSFTVTGTVAPLSVKVTDAGYATYYNDYAVEIPAGLTAYWGKLSNDGTKLEMTEITDGIIPAETAVLVKGAANTYALTATAEVGGSYAENALRGVVAETSVSSLSLGSGTVYVLAKAKSTGNAAFCQFNGTTLGDHRAFLFVADSTAPMIDFDFGGTTGINEVNESVASQSEFKVNGEYYNLAGQRVAQPTKGLYIVNGRKVVIK